MINSDAIRGLWLLSVAVLAASTWPAGFFTSTASQYANYNAAAKTFTIGNDRVERSVRYDSTAMGLFTVSWKDKSTGLDIATQPSSEGFFLFNYGNDTVDLSRNFNLASPAWDFTDNAEIKGGGVKTVRIYLSGTGKYAGVSITVCYDVYPGNEPWMTKWYAISGASAKNNYTFDRITYDNFNIGTLLNTSFVSGIDTSYTSLCILPSAANAQNACLVSILNWNSAISASGSRLGLGMSMGVNNFGSYMKWRNGKTTKAFEGFATGDLSTFKFHYQIFANDRHIPFIPGRNRPFFEAFRDAPTLTANVEQYVLKAKQCGIGILCNDPAAFTGYPHDVWSHPEITTDMRRTAFLANTFPSFFNPDSIGSLAYYCRQDTVPLLLYQGNEGVPMHLGISQCDTTYYAHLIQWGGQLSARSRASGWFFEDRDAGGGCRTLWQEAFRQFSQSVRTNCPNAQVGRTWVYKLDAMDVADWSQPTDKDNQGQCDAWGKFFMSLPPLFPTFSMKESMGIHFTGLTNAQYEGVLSRGAMVASMMFSMGLGSVSASEIPLANKWVTWHLQNQPWLQYAQPVETVAGDSLWGVMHLRNLYQGKYGYIGWWWKTGTFSLKINPAQWLVTMDAANLAIKSLRTGSAVPFTANGGTITVGPCSTDWDVLELTSTAPSGLGKAEKQGGEEIALEGDPNPFNPVVMMSFQIPGAPSPEMNKSLPVHLSIYNAQGKLVSTLVEGKMRRGRHSVSWNAVGIPSGIYFARLQAGNTVFTRALMLLK